MAAKKGIVKEIKKPMGTFGFVAPVNTQGLSVDVPFVDIDLPNKGIEVGAEVTFEEILNLGIPTAINLQRVTAVSN